MLGRRYGVGRGKAAAQLILTQPAKSERRQLPLLLPTLLLLKPLLLLASQMATSGLTHRLLTWHLISHLLGLTSQLQPILWPP